jgi:hypothetical protein
VCPSWKQLSSYHVVWYERHATVGHYSLVLSKDTKNRRTNGMWKSCRGNLFLECKMYNMAAMRIFLFILRFDFHNVGARLMKYGAEMGRQLPAHSAWDVCTSAVASMSTRGSFEVMPDKFNTQSELKLYVLPFLTKWNEVRIMAIGLKG